MAVLAAAVTLPGRSLCSPAESSPSRPENAQIPFLPLYLLVMSIAEGLKAQQNVHQPAVAHRSFLFAELPSRYNPRHQQKKLEIYIDLNQSAAVLRASMEGNERSRCN